MTTSGRVIPVTTVELDAVFDRVQREGYPELVIVGPDIWLPEYDPESWPRGLQGRLVYRLSVPDRPLVQLVAGHTHLRQLGLWGLGLNDEDVRVIAARLPQLTSLSINRNEIGEGGRARDRGAAATAHVAQHRP
jgi:hypothetical protein